MNASRIAVGAAIMVAGLGMASGIPHPPWGMVGAPFGPVFKCQGGCLIGDAASHADARIISIEHQHVAGRTHRALTLVRR